jgi:ATP-dependent Clp protease adaptor protein ClpS
MIDFSILMNVANIASANSSSNEDEGDGFEAGVATKSRKKTKRPALYQVMLLNDDYTPMDFVVHILVDVFNKTSDEAIKIMLSVHNDGSGVAGVFPYEVAETKVTHVMDLAIKNSHPLKCVMEKQ